MRPRRLAVVALAGVAAVSLAACTSSGSGSPSSPDASATAPIETPTPSDSLLPSDTELPTDSASSSQTATSPPAMTHTSTSTQCPTAQLRLTAERGSGYQGREFAQILFTNKGTKTCTMFGFPGVSLRRGGALLGKPAIRESVTPKIVTLRPGETATADITDFSTCNAPLSDTVRVYPPDSKLFVDLPLDLRGCTISVKPVVHE